eukprot:4426478-Karenia_brevis.AAC.1
MHDRSARLLRQASSNPSSVCQNTFLAEHGAAAGATLFAASDHLRCVSGRPSSIVCVCAKNVRSALRHHVVMSCSQHSCRTQH